LYKQLDEIGAPIRLENLPASAYSGSDSNKLGLPKLAIRRQLVLVPDPMKSSILDFLRHS
jgi:hypothetical protein